MASYGALLSTPIIEAGAIETLRLYLPAYLGEALAQAGFGRYDVPDPQDTYVSSNEADQPHEAQFALLRVATPGTDGDAQINPGADGTYSASWSIVAGVVCGMNDYRETRQSAGFYSAASMCLAHKGLTPPERIQGASADLPEAAADALSSCSVEWRGEHISNRTPDKSERTVIFGGGRFDVWVSDARARWGGPDTPPDPGDRPELFPGLTPDEVNVTTRKVAVEDAPP